MADKSALTMATKAVLLVGALAAVALAGKPLQHCRTIPRPGGQPVVWPLASHSYARTTPLADAVDRQLSSRQDAGKHSNRIDESIV